MTVLGFTRPASKLGASVKEAESMGFTVIATPSLEVRMADGSEFRRLEESLVPGAVAVFGSTTAVDMCQAYFGERLSSVFSGHPVFAIGAKTAENLKALGIAVRELPQEYSSYGLLESFAGEFSGKRVVMVRSDSGTEVLSEGMSDLGAELVDIAAYTLVDAGVTDGTVAMMEAIRDGRMDWIAFTSPMSASVFFGHMEERFGDDGLRMMCSRVRVAAIGRPTAEELKSMGRPADLVPQRSTFRDLLEAIARTDRS